MAGIDDSVVSIKFDNAAFEQKVASTIASLDKLRLSLDFASSSRGMQDLGAAAKSFDMAPMASAVDGVSAKFVGMATVGITALANITSRVVDAGLQFGKSLTLGPITQGFGEFELKMGSIQTIMAGSGASLEVVNEKLQQLNEYSDKTIYSFKDMTSNIGKFTNAGVSLDQSVAAIQGVANVAALSGANADEASRAMYNFAQSISSGSVKLMDWKSIELANMATVEFKQQLIDTAVAAGTLTKTTDGYKTAAGSVVTPTKGFNESLSDQWLTSQALTDTLGKYSDATTDIGARATKAATEVKTFSQMISTMKESVGSGWATTFENIFGNFEQGTKLWTDINSAFGKVVGASADARNLMFKTWNDFGARDTFINSLGEIIGYLGDIVAPIKEAFRDIFPKKTGEDLIMLTHKFELFTEKLKLGGDTAKAIKTFFSAFFSILDIGWEIFKGVTKVVFALAKGIMTLVAPLLRLAAGSTGVVTGFHDMLVGGGGLSAFFSSISEAIGDGANAIADFISVIIKFFGQFAPLLEPAFNAIKNFAGGVVDFFSGLGPIISMPLEALKRVTKAIGDFFKNLSFGGKEENGVAKASKDLEGSASLAERLLAALKNVFSQIGDTLGGIVDFIAGAFKGLGGAIADALGSGDFNQVLDVIKVGLLGGILTMLYKFFKSGIKLDFGQSGIVEKLKDLLGTLTSSLKTLQTNIRADTLQKIAIAMGILAIAIVALSLVDGAALAKAMAAMTAGFAQLTAVMVILDKSMGESGSVKIVAMGVAFVLLAAAMALLVIPIKVLSTMDLVELAKGLGGVAVAMIAMTYAVSLIGSDTANLVKAGISMIFISLALIVLAKAIQAFAEMKLTEMALGLAQAALGIGLLILALKAMPDDIVNKGIGLLILALALKSIARVVQLFAGMPIAVLAKGFIAIALGLQEIGFAMQTFPDDMVQKAAGLILVSAALYIIAMAVEKMGSLDLATLAKGMGAFIIMLTLLSAAILLMSEAEGGVAGLLAAAAGLLIIGYAIEKVGSIPFGDLVKGILGLAAVLAVLAIASLVAPGILLLGIALVAVGLGLALVGAGVALAGKGFELMAKFGGEAMGHITEAIQELIRQLPQFVSAFVEGFIQAFIEIGNQAPKLIEVIKTMLIALLDAVIEIVPKIAETLGTIISAFLTIVREKIPEFIATGFAILLALLQGLRDNIGEIVTLVADIILEFLDALTLKLPELVDGVVKFLVAMIKEVIDVIVGGPALMVELATYLMEGMLTGLVTAAVDVITWFTELPGKILKIIMEAFGINSPSTKFLDIGIDIITGFLNGLVETVVGVMDWFIALPGKILGWLGDVLTTLVTKGGDFISGLISGIVAGAIALWEWWDNLVDGVIEWIGDVAESLLETGTKLIGGLLNGITEKAKEVTTWFTSLPVKIKNFLLTAGKWLIETGNKIIEGLLEGMEALWPRVRTWLNDRAQDIIDIFASVLLMFSPSRVFIGFGKNIMVGLRLGLASEWGHVATWLDDAATSIRDTSLSAINQTIDAIANQVGTIDEFSPTITPVLDLSKVQMASRGINKLLSIPIISPEVSFAQARLISTTADTTGTANDISVPGPTEISFEQNIYAPLALSTNDIYRNTKSQIALAKEELNIA